MKHGAISMARENEIKNVRTLLSDFNLLAVASLASPPLVIFLFCYGQCLVFHSRRSPLHRSECSQGIC